MRNARPVGVPGQQIRRREVGVKQLLGSRWVDLELKVTESGVKKSIFNSKSYDQMVTHGHNPDRPEMFIQFTRGQTMNFGMVNDPEIISAFNESAATLLRPGRKRQAGQEYHPLHH